MKKKIRELRNATKRIERHLLAVLKNLKETPSLLEAVKVIQNEDVKSASVKAAADIRQLAIRFHKEVRTLQYREFFVSAIAICLIPISGGRYKWFVRAGWNTKPHQNAGKFCAEMRTMRAAREHHSTYILRTIICGMPREEDENAAGGFLRVCEACRVLIRGKYADCFLPEAEFVSTRPDRPDWVRHTVEELRHQHGDHCVH